MKVKRKLFQGLGIIVEACDFINKLSPDKLISVNEWQGGNFGMCHQIVVWYWDLEEKETISC